LTKSAPAIFHSVKPPGRVHGTSSRTQAVGGFSLGVEGEGDEAVANTKLLDEREMKKKAVTD